MKFKPGDRVIFLKKESYDFGKGIGYGYLSAGTVFGYANFNNDSLIVQFDNGYRNLGNLDSLFELEEIYNSPLYKLMKEE